MTAAAPPRICAACGEQVATDPCPRCGSSTLLDGRYVLRCVLGKGAQATTWLAETLDGRRVAIKELRVDADDKSRELVTREARVLKQIVVPDVPRYVDEFVTSSGRQRLLCVVQEYVDGPTLEAYARDRRLTVDEALDLVDALLGILAALHALSPPVIHRDIKPANVILRGGTRVTLVDFGSVRDAWVGTLGGSTVTGTFGYMPPEQFAGDASPASDVYAVATVLVALLSRVPPASMLGSQRTLAWRPHLRVDDRLGHWLDRCLHANPALRPGNAALARAELAAARAGLRGPSDGPRTVLSDASNAAVLAGLDPALLVRDAERVAMDDPFHHLPAGAVLRALVPVKADYRVPIGIGAFLVAVGFAVVMTLSANAWEAAPPVPAPVAAPAPPIVRSPPPIKVGPPPSTVPTGAIEVRSNRRVLIVVDGKPVDYTPANVALEPGAHVVSASLAGKPETMQSVTVDLLPEAPATRVEFAF